MTTVLKPGEPVETKYHIVDNQIVNMHTGETVPFEEVVILRSRDNAVPQALEAYRIACERLGAPVQHIAGAKNLLERVQAWRSQNAELCRLPGLRYLREPMAAQPAGQCCGGGSCAGG